MKTPQRQSKSKQTPVSDVKQLDVANDHRTIRRNDGDAMNLLFETGLLFELNRRVLHPLGLALGSYAPGDGSKGGVSLLDGRFDPEGITFGPEAFRDGRARFERFLAEGGQASLYERRKLLGFVEQLHPNQG